jgi:succinate dehydrogenase / fumarate reductase membrane anchor subunit
VNAWTWLLQRISACVLLVALGLHIWFLHLAHTGEVIHYSEIIKRLGTPIFITLDILLLIFGLYHAIYGVYSVFLDFGFEFRTRVIVLGLLVAAAIGFLGLGIYGFWAFLGLSA